MIKRRLSHKVLTMLSASALSVAVYVAPANAQDAIPGGDSGGNTSNPLEGLFTPQPQYPTPRQL